MSVPPSSPLCRPRYSTDSAQISYSCCKFSRILEQFEILWIHTDQCEDCFHYQSTVHNIQGSYWYFAQPLSWVGAWILLIMASLFPFSRILWNFEILWIHINWCLSLDSLLPYSSQFFVYPVQNYHSYWLISARMLLITVSFVTISKWEITHFPWSWSDHINL